MVIQPEIFLRIKVLEEYSENAIQADLESDIIPFLEDHPGVWWNAYAQVYGVNIREFPYEARNGFFIDTERRVCLYRFESKGILRRDSTFSDDVYRSVVPPIYRPTWFDPSDASRTYAVLISKIERLSVEIPVEEFGLYNSWGKVSSKDQFHHPRLIKPTWELIKKKYETESR